MRRSRCFGSSWMSAKVARMSKKERAWSSRAAIEGRRRQVRPVSRPCALSEGVEAQTSRTQSCGASA